MNSADIQAIVRALRNANRDPHSERRLQKLEAVLHETEPDILAPALIDSEELSEVLGEAEELRRAADKPGATDMLIHCTNSLNELTARVMFARLLRSARERAGYGVRELARASGVSNAYISQIEHAQTAPPSLKVARKLVRVLGLSAQDLADFYPAEILTPSAAGEETELLRDPGVQTFLRAAGALSAKERQMLAEIAQVIRRFSKSD